MQFLIKVKTKIIVVTTEFFLKLSLFINSPRLTALILAITVRRVNKNGEFTVLCLGRSIFSLDVNALAVFGKNIKYITIQRHLFRIILHHFLTKLEIEQLTEVNYHTHDIGKKGKQKYYSYLKKMFPTLCKFLNIDVIMSGNFGYIEQQEIARLCENEKKLLQIPFIVLHKEGLAMAGFHQRKLAYNNHQFIGARIFLYNDKIKDYLIKNNIKGLSLEKIRIIGIPRLDAYIHNKNFTKEKQIVFFAFYPEFRFNYLIKDDNQRLVAYQRSEQFYRYVMNFAKDNPEVKVIIKTKVAKFFLDYVKDIFNKYFKEPLDNLEITNIGDSAQLIPQSMAVIGFNSTTLIEAVIANKVAISPYFGDIITDKPWDYFTGFEELINYAKDENDLQRYIFNIDKYLNYDIQIKDKYLSQIVDLPLGNSSRKTEEEIIKTIKEYKNV